MQSKQAKRWMGKALGAKGLAAGVLLAALSGCTAMKDHRGFLVDQALVDSVLPGVDNKMSVERTLGRPTLASQFGDPVWYYVSTDTRQVAFHTPTVVKQTVLRVRFDAKGRVIGVDHAGAEKVAKITPEQDYTKVLGKKRTLIEDLFGNIGTVNAAGGGQGGAPGGGGRGPNGS